MPAYRIKFLVIERLALCSDASNLLGHELPHVYERAN